ncbi:MAG: hypothetical protein AAGD25_32560 [Cyanobacteria bacterium P01_F01_bin.150]
MPKSRKSRSVRASLKGIEKLNQSKAAAHSEGEERLTIPKIAERAKLGEKTVGNFFRGEPVDPATATAICQVLKLPLDEILEPTQQQTVLDNCGQKGPNPFNYGSPVEPDRFYGRWSARSDIKNRIGAKTAQSINIVGLRRMGKTSLLHYVRERIDEFCLPEQKPLVVSLDFQNPKFHSPYGIIEGLRREIKDATKQSLWTREDNDDAFAVEDGLMNLRDQGYRLIVMIDEFEGIARRLESFQDWGEDWRSKASAGLLTLMMATKRPLDEIYKPLQLTSPFHNIFSTTVLGVMEAEEWQRLVKDEFETQVSDDALGWIDRLAGRCPLFVQMAASLLWQHGDLKRAEAKFRDEAEKHFQTWWDSLNIHERAALHAIVKHQIPIPSITERLQRYGLVTIEKDCFRSTLANWVQERQA